MSTAISVADYKLQTTFINHDTVSHVNDKPGLVRQTTWTKDKELGVGSFGEVWREKEIRGGFRAVKTIKKFTLKSNKIDYERELQVLMKVKDYPESFVVFFGWYEDQHSVYLAMEYVPHGDLGGYMKIHGVIKESDSVEIAQQILHGLEILHENRICHRDLKPQNILIASLSPLQIKIADFGISISQPRTYLQTTCGTRSYQAPEQLGLLPPGCQLRRGYTKAVDIWAVGVLLYKMLSSVLPFQTNDDGTIFDSDRSTHDTEGDQEPSIDYTMLFHYCHGLSLFPTRPLLEAGASTLAVDFVKSLLAAKPKERVSARNARMNPWIIGRDGTLPGLARVLRSQFMLLGVQFRVLITHNFLDSRAGSMMVADDRMAYSTPLHTIHELEKEAARREYPEAAVILRVFIGLPSNTTYFPLLTLAAAGGHLDAVSLLLANGADLNSAAEVGDGRTPLQAASEGGHLDVIDFLLCADADVNAAPGKANGRTALQAAAGRGHVNAISLLLSKGASINAEAGVFGGKTALQAAAAGRHIDVMLLLLKAGANPNAPPSLYDGSTALQEASKIGHLHAIQLLLTSGADVNAVPCAVWGRTALQAAAGNGHIDAMLCLLSRGADVNAAPAHTNGRTALQAAAQGGNTEAIRILLRNGADVNAVPGYLGGRSALEAAVGGGYLDTVILLLSSGSNVHTVHRMFDGYMSLQAAAGKGNSAATRIVQWSGADAIGRTYSPADKMALQEAVWCGDMAAVQVLLKGGADTDSPVLDPSGTISRQMVSDASISDSQLQPIYHRVKKCQ